MNALKYSITAAALALAGSLVGCETGAGAVERDFGASVRQVFPAQVHNAAAQASPSASIPPAPDGEMVKAAVDAARKDVAQRGEVKQPIVISLGGGN